MQTTKPKLLILTGATASGKSEFLYNSLQDLPLTVINADSRQVYRDLVISSASPSGSEMQVHTHELYNFLPLDAVFSAGEFIREVKYALQKAAGNNRFPVICGGTYFYIHSLIYGLLPEILISDAIEQEVNGMRAEMAYSRLKSLDPAAAGKIHPHNEVKWRRALKLCLAHARPISTIARTGGLIDTHDILMVIFNRPRAELKQRAEMRVQAMFANGIVDEVGRVYDLLHDSIPLKKAGALTAIGVQEFLQADKNPLSLNPQELREVAQHITRNTHALIKRQLTWLNNAEKPADTKTIDPAYEIGLIAKRIRDFIQRTP